MSVAGWHYLSFSPSDDSVQCTYCEKSLSGFEKGDDPIEEHRRRVPDCPFFSYKMAVKPKKGKMEDLGVGATGGRGRGKSVSRQAEEGEEKSLRTMSKSVKKKTQETEVEEEEPLVEEVRYYLICFWIQKC